MLFAALVACLSPQFRVFCLPRERPVRMVDSMTPEWRALEVDPSFKGQARPGEFFVFQVVVDAQENTGPLEMSFGSLRGPKGDIGAGALRCISLGGVDFRGKPFSKRLIVPKGALQPLWVGVDVPSSARGAYRGRLTLAGAKPIPVEIDVAGAPVADHGAGNAKSLARLRWLDSTAGESDSIVKPYLPIRLRGRTLSILGRDLTLGQNGLPAQIASHFSAANTSIGPQTHDVLASPIRFEVGDRAEKYGLIRVEAKPAMARWSVDGRGKGFDIHTSGHLDPTGSGSVDVTLTATQDLNLDDIALDVPYARDSATYMMGLNRQGGLRPASWSWNWDVKRHQDCFWIGAVNAGLMVRLKDENYRRPLVNIYYHFRPLLLPEGWGTGGVKVFEQGSQVIARAYSGPRQLRKGQVLHFVADFYLTPFRPIDTDRQWATRFDHPHPSRNENVLEQALADADPVHGPNVIDVHQATYYNPYINYPYSPDSFPAFTDFVRRAHEKGVRARVYYTTREITQNMPELFALHSLDGEVVFPGPGKDAKTLINPNGPDPWLIANLGRDFVPAWVDHTTGGKYNSVDLSVITTPDSRWNNFYLEGLKWMVDKAKIDGVYIDDTALDASSLQRARRILAARPNPIIDLHSWNHFNEYAGYANNLNMYMEVLPYLDRLWLGEGFDANAAPWDYWLVEMSGLPFGLMSEMLDGANTARGLVFGETARLNWSGDPRPIWKVWDEYGIKGTQMIPFFDPSCPVKTGDPQIKATVYKGKDHAFIAIASWADKPVSVKLSIDLKALGLKPGDLVQPGIAGFQQPSTVHTDDPIVVNPKSGLLLLAGHAESGRSHFMGY